MESQGGGPVNPWAHKAIGPLDHGPWARGLSMDVGADMHETHLLREVHDRLLQDELPPGGRGRAGNRASVGARAAGYKLQQGLV